MESHIKTRIVSAIIKDAEKGKIDFSHPLQRQEGQWTRYTQSLEMDSLVRGWPINFIFIWKNDNKNYVLEGKQRITSLLSFKQDKYALSKKLEPVEIDGVQYDIAGKKFSKLDEAVQEKLLNAELPTYELSDCPAEVAREIFLRLNSGKPLNRAQKLVGIMDYDVSAEIRKIMQHPFWTKTGITKGDIKSDNIRKVACQILMLVSNYEFTAFDQGNIEKYVETLNSDVDGSVQLIDHVVNILDKMDAKIESKIDKMTKLSIPMVVGAMNLVYGDDAREDAYLQKVAEFFEQYDAQTEYLQYCERSTNTGENVNGRWKIFKEMVASL
mgnify:FL=1